MNDYSKLQQLAEAADRQMPSPWFVHRDGMGSEFPPHPEQNFGIDDARGWAVAWHGVGRNSGIWLEEVAEFIAAANPAAVRALIIENEALRKDAERYRWLSEKFGVTNLPCAAERILGGDMYVADGKASIDAAIDAAMKEVTP